MGNASKQIRLSPDKDNGDRVIHKPGAKRASARASTKAEGLKRIAEIARNQGLESKIQKQDGTIGGGNSYGNDPFPPRDTK